MDFSRCNGTLIAHRYRRGAGPIVVFAHALGCDQTIWDDVIAALDPAQAVLSYDLRGHGARGREDDPDVTLRLQT